MGLSRLLIVIILVFAGFWLWRRLTRKRDDGKAQHTTLPMVRCVHCGVHVPQEQALQAEGRWYCSRAHLKQDSESGGQ